MATIIGQHFDGMWKIITNIGWIFFDKIFRLLVGMLVSVWIARYLGPSEFGLLNYALLFPTIFMSFAGFGLTNILLVDFVAANDDPAKQHRLVQTGLFIKLIVGTLAYIISCSLNYILNSDKPLLFQLINFAGIILILQSSDVIDTYFQSQTKAKLSIIVKLIAFGLASLLRIYALLTHQEIVFLIIINIIELLIVYVLAIAVYQQKVAALFLHIRQAINNEVIQQLIRLAWPVMITEFLVFIYTRIDQFMIESLSTSQQLGLYGAVTRLSEAWYFISAAITTSLYPKIAALWDTDRAAFYKSYQQMLKLLMYISICVAVFTNLLADPIINFLYGNKYDGAGIILSVHIWTGLFVYIGIGTTNLFVINNLQRFVLGRTLIGAIINIGLNCWLIPRYNALGASIATLVAQFCSAYALNFFYDKAKPIFYMQSRALLSVLMLQKPVIKLGFWLMCLVTVYEIQNNCAIYCYDQNSHLISKTLS